jgi:WD40 repeat protein
MVDKNENLYTINFASFNQDGTCFAVGTDSGFKIFACNPFRDNFDRNLEGGIGICEMLNRCNILALVGGGKSPKYSPNRVIIWDDHQTKVVSELRFTSYVRNVKLKKDRLFVVCDQKIYVFNFQNFQNIDTIDTYENSKGLISISVDPKVNILAYPDKTQGLVRIKLYDKDSSLVIQAHESSLACMAMNSDGSILATASDKGTLIRVYNCYNGQLIQELRRGSEKAIIYSIAFNQTSNLLAVSSDRGTVHIFSIANAIKSIKEGNFIE